MEAKVEHLQNGCLLLSVQVCDHSTGVCQLRGSKCMEGRQGCRQCDVSGTDHAFKAHMAQHHSPGFTKHSACCAALSTTADSFLLLLMMRAADAPPDMGLSVGSLDLEHT
jgi:hypothetical protein